MPAQGRPQRHRHQMDGRGRADPVAPIAPSTLATSAVSASASRTRPARTSPLAAWTSAMSIDRCQLDGNVGAERARRLTALDERRERVQHRAMTLAQRLGGPCPGVDRDERVVATERAPRRGDDAPERLGGLPPIGLGRRDDRGGLRERPISDRLEQHLARREVHVDRRAHDPCATSDLRHARVLIVSERVDRGVEDARDAALGVGSPARRGSVGRSAGSGHGTLSGSRRAGRGASSAGR